MANPETPPTAQAAPPNPPPAPARRVIVCLNCGHIWEANQKTARPQCFDCKKTRTRAATAEEIALMDSGKTSIRADAEPPQPEAKRQHREEPTIDRKVDPVALIDPSSVKPKPAQLIPEPTPEIEIIQETPRSPPILLIALTIGGIIAALLIAVFIQRARNAAEEDQTEEEEPPAPQPAQRAPQYGGRLPGMS